MRCESVLFAVVVDVKSAMSSLADNHAAGSSYLNYVALYDFAARNFDELSLKAGDHVLVIIPTCLCIINNSNNTHLALRSSGPCQDNGQQEFAICACL